MRRHHARHDTAVAAALLLLSALLLATPTLAFVPMPGARVPPPAAAAAAPNKARASIEKATSASAAAGVAGPAASSSTAASPLAAAVLADAPVRPRRRRQRQQQETGPESMPLVAAADVDVASTAAAASAAVAEAEAALTPEERRTRGQVRAIQRASLAGAKQKELRRALGRAPTESEWVASLGLSSAAALRVAMEQGARAREELGQGWRGLVHKLVARHATFLPPSELEDLADEGFAGLMEAALRFKPGQAAFSTYAFYWVRKRVLSAVAARDRTTFQSLGEHALGSKVQQAMHAGFEATGRSPALAKVAAAVGVTEARAAELLRKGRRYQLLEATTSGYVRFADTLSDPEAPGADGALEAVYLAEVEEGVARAIAGLPAEERTVLGLRLGLADGQPKSWEELSRVMDGCSVSYLRKVEARAKTHLRRNVEVMKLLHRRPPSLFGEEAAGAGAGAALW